MRNGVFGSGKDLHVESAAEAVKAAIREEAEEDNSIILENLRDSQNQ
jgi:hypothetical protein